MAELAVSIASVGRKPRRHEGLKPYAASLSGGGGEPLCAAAASESCIAHGALEEGAIHRIQMGQQSGDLGQERVGKNGGDFLVAHAPRIPNQLADVDIESRSQALQRAERRNG